MKKLFLISTVILHLSACGVGVNPNGVSVGLGLGGMIGHHVGLGTSVNIPLTFDKKDESVQNHHGEINIIDQKIVTYFDTQGQPTDSEVKGGYYRQLISKQGNSQFIVQDFYATGQKRTDPMLLDRSNIFEFRAHPKNGTHTVYAINGAVMSQYTYQDNQIIKLK